VRAFSMIATVAGALLLLSACTAPPPAVDLLRAEGALGEATVAGQGRAVVLPQVGRSVRINDVVRRTLPAGPPSRYRFRLDIPKGARLAVTCAIPEPHQSRPGVEFVVKVARGGREDTIWTKLVDPLGHPEHRGWLEADIDLSRHAGRGAELVLETRGYEETGDPTRAVWGTPALTAPRDDSPLVVVYLVDTLRADHTGPYGYPRNTTPHLTAFARDAVVFEQAIAHASWTKPSVASLMTSLLPGQHRAVQLRDPLDASHLTLAEMMHAKRYATGAAIANSVIYGAESSFDRGFDYFAGLHGEDDRPSKLVNADVVVDAALAWLDARRGLPTFLYVHTMDPHVPYAPPPPFDMMFEPHPAPGHPAADPRTDYKEPLDRERMIAQYDGDIAYGDREFGRFVQGLRARGLYERALVVFLGDHGEEFLDHGQWLHGRSVFDELVHIPLLVKFPGQRNAGRRVAQQVQEVDILPTVLENQGLPVPAPPLIAGRPLQRVLVGTASPTPAVSEISHRGFVAHGIRTEADKYIRRFSPTEDELYFDLVHDPKETRSILGSAPERLRILRAGVEAATAPNPFRHTLKIAGAGEYGLAFKTGGWIEGVEATGLGPGERYEIQENGRRLELRVRPRPGRPREVAFTVRPMGAPVWLEGTRDGRALRPRDVAIGRSAAPADAVPLRLPEIESAGGGEHFHDLFAPPQSDPPGVQVWLTLPPGRTLMEFNKETQERLKALGYLGPG
jgi:arylsulfatase A-like enzyme